jgi:hypothetical protein
MPVIVRETSVAANAIDPNVLSGSVFEYARTRAILSMGHTQAATGNRTIFNVGADVVAEEFAPPIATVYPIIPDDFYFQDIAEQGDRIVVAVRNTTGGALVVRTIVIVTNA